MSYKRTIFKIGLISIASFFIIISIGFIILVNFVDPNKYKPLIIETVNHNTGRTLQLSGNISWQIWPNIGLHIKQVSLSNPEGFQNSNFIEIQNANLSVDLLPLFHNKIVINDLNIDGLKLNLIEKNKKNNWTFASNQSAPKSQNSARFELHSFSITNSEINYNNADNKTSKNVRIANFHLDTPQDGGIRFNGHNQQINLDNVNFNLNNHLKGALTLELNNDSSKLKYNGNLTINPFSLNQLLNQLGQKPIKIKNNAILDNISLTSNFNGNDKSANLANLHLVISQSTLEGTIHITSFSPLNIQNDLLLNQLETSDWVDTSGYLVPMHEISLRGTLSNTNSGLTKLTADEHLNVNNITVYGIDADEKIRYAEKTLTVSRFANPLNLVERLDEMLSPSSYTQKNLKQKTNLGKLNTNINIKNGFLTTPEFLLIGPTVKTTTTGYANFNKKYIDFTLYSKIVYLASDSLLGSLDYPYSIKGNLNNPDTGIEKLTLQKEIISYYTRIGKAGGAINSIKQGSKNLWNKLFH